MTTQIAKKSRTETSSVDKSDFRLVAREHWADARESEIYNYFALMVHKSIYKEDKVPIRAQYEASGMGYYVCCLEAPAGSSETHICGVWVACSSRNRGVERHLEKHPNLTVTKQRNPAAGKLSNFQQVVAVMESGLAFSPFCDPDGPLRKSGLVPNFVSAPTVRKYAVSIIQGAVVNIAEALDGLVVGVSFDFTPLPHMEVAAVNVHFYGAAGPATVTLAVQSMTGSLTSIELEKWLRRAFEVYGIESIAHTHVPLHALQLWVCTDSGANVARTARMLTEVRALAQHSEFEDLWTWSFCLVHGANLAIQDALKHGAVVQLVEKVFSALASTRSSRDIRERILEQGISAPGRIVRTRWRTALKLIEYVVTNADKLAAADDELVFNQAEVSMLACIHGLLEPLDSFIVRGQADVAGDAFFLPLNLIGMLAKMKTCEGLKKPCANSSEKAPLLSADFGAVLGPWREFVLAIVEERFFSFETEHFDDIEPETDDDGGDDGATSAERLSGMRFKRGNVLMHSAVRAIYALTPIASVWSHAVEERALSGDNAVAMAEEDKRKAIGIVLQLRYACDRDWRDAVDSRSSSPVAAASSGAGNTLLQRLSQVASPRTSVVDDAAADLRRFAESPAVRAALLEYIGIPEAERPLAADKALLHKWVEAADKQAVWLGKLLRTIIVAPLRSTKCESDFSILQHLQAPRRQRMSMKVLAAYMLCKRARSFVTEPPTTQARTTEGTLDILSYAAPRAPASRVAAPRVVTSDVRAAAPSPQSTVDTPSAAPIEVLSDSDKEVDAEPEEEADLKRVEVVTRSGRRARTFAAATVVQRIMPSGRRRGAGHEEAYQTDDEE